MIMRIAQIAPLAESVPPRLYGGTERVVSWLTEELFRQGHEVTLFASGDSVTSARLISVVPEAVRLSKSIKIGIALHILMLEKVFQMIDEFDVLHFHVDLFHYSACKRLGRPWLNTLHGRLDLPELADFFGDFRDAPVISISDSQRAPLPWLNWRRTIHHGLPSNLYTFKAQPSDYLLFLGRVSPEKRIDRAIEIASRAGQRLIIAAKVDPVDEKYFQESIRPLFDNPLVEYIGEVPQEKKNELIGNAQALLFPIDWPEPFGIVTIEALACGTPVIAWNCGSVPEIIESGITGFICSSIEEAVNAVKNIDLVDRRRCREIFEKRFDVKVMADKYLAVYEELLAGEQSHSGAEGSGERKCKPANTFIAYSETKGSEKEPRA
jgi:glycosyltransferase involved in cell wall biosynthesis